MKLAVRRRRWTGKEVEVATWTRAWAPACAVVILALAACSDGPAEKRAGDEDAGHAGSAAADAGEVMEFTLPDLDGKPVRLADYRGKTVVIDFWATWCPPCEFQVPELNKFWERNADRGDVMVIGVSVDVEGAKAVAPWAQEKGVEYQLVLGDESVARDFGAMGFPTLVVLRPDGTVYSRHVGLIEVDDLEELVADARGVGAT